MEEVARASLLASSNLSEREKQELQQFIQSESQKVAIQSSIHRLTDVCFRKCITSKISASKLDKYEEPCMQNCVERFIDANHLALRQLDKIRETGG